LRGPLAVNHRAPPAARSILRRRRAGCARRPRRHVHEREPLDKPANTSLRSSTEVATTPIRRRLRTCTGVASVRR
jgi:hypothetical protein